MLPLRPLKAVNFNLPSCHRPPVSLTHTQLSNKGFRLQWTVLASWWWSVCTLRVRLIGIHMMLVDFLHINRWLCGDNVQHIVLAMMHWHTHAHRHIQRVCLFFKNPKAVTGTFINLSISEEERQSLSGVWAGIPEQMSPCIHPLRSCNNTTNKSSFVLLPLLQECA